MISRRQFLAITGAVVTAPTAIMAASAAPAPTLADVAETHWLLETSADGSNYGGIDRASFKFWRNQQDALDMTSGNVFDSARFNVAMRDAYNECRK